MILRQCLCAQLFSWNNYKDCENLSSGKSMKMIQLPDSQQQIRIEPFV